jgi:CubicO group peptidase (beta-lactamase class C family)
MLTVLTHAYAQNKADQLDSLFSKLHKEDRFSGNVLIAESGRAIFQKSYGKAFREKNIDLNSETVFELASVSKQFTAMGIMLLKKQGRISYDDSLGKFFPKLPYYKITIRQLLQHTSGLPDYLTLSRQYWDSTKIMTNRDMIAMLEENRPPRIFASGEKWQYSNTGYALLASVIEKVSGKSFQDYMAENIFRPLGMSRTRVYRKRFENKLIDNYAFGYVKDRSGNYVMADSLPATASLVYSMDGIYGDGVVNSTTGDLLKWDQALYTEKLVSKEMLSEAFTDAKLNNGKSFNYGFGWLLGNSPEFGRYYFHAGGWPGYVTWMERHPRDNKTIILLANAGEAHSSIREIRNIVYGIKSKPPVEIALDEKVLSQYTGSYLFDNGDTLAIRIDGGKLFAGVIGGKEHQLFPEAADLFFRKDRNDAKIRMVKDSNGVVTGLEILREGPTIEAKKILPAKQVERKQ